MTSMFFNMYVFECPFLRRVRLTQIIKENSGFSYGVGGFCAKGSRDGNHK
jgi:hypothetical protein